MFAIKINVNIKLFFISLFTFLLLLNKQLLSQDIPIIVIAPLAVMLANAVATDFVPSEN